MRKYKGNKMAQIEKGESLHKTNLGWFVSLENKINELKMMGKSIFWIFGAGLVGVFGAAFITTHSGLYHSNLPVGFYLDFLKLSIHSITNSDYVQLWKKSLSAMTSDLSWMIIVHSPVGFGIGYFLFNRVKNASDVLAETTFIDGTKIISEKARLEQLKKMHEKGEFKFRFRIGRIPLPYTSEANSTIIIATSGGGKGVLLSRIMKTAGNMKDIKGLVHDAKPDITGTCFHPERGDLIFNPADARSVKWSVFNDIRTIFDLKSFARWIVPVNTDPKGEHFDGAARQIIESVLMKLWEDDDTTNVSIRRAINMPVDELAKFLRGYPGEKHLKNGDVLSTLSNKMGWLDFLPDGEFSIRKWIDEAERGLIFLSNGEETAALFAPVLNLFINAAGSHVLSLPDDAHGRRFFFFLDEFPTLGRIDRIIDLLTKARSKGNGIFIALQDPSQGEKIYGDKDWRTIIAACKNKAFGQIGDDDSALKLSKAFGKQAFYENGTTKSMGVADNRDGMSLQEARKEDYAVRDYQLINLPERQFYVRINGLEGVTLTTADIQEMPKIAENFVGLNLTKSEQIAMVRAADKATMAKKEAEALEGEITEELEEEISATYENEYGL